MSIDAFTPRVLTRSVNKTGDALRNLLLTRLFGERNTHPTNTIDFGVLKGNVKVSGYTRPGEPAKPVDKLVGDLKTINAPEIRLKKALDRSFYSTLNPGVAGFSGPYMNVNDQTAEKVIKEQEDLRRKIERQMEVTSAEALRTGQATLTYADGSTVTVDYEYVATAGDAKTIQTTLTGTDKWNDPVSKPLKTLSTLARQIRQYSSWDGELDVLMGYDALESFLENAQVKTALDNRRIEFGGMRPVERGAVQGNIKGLTIFEYVMSYDAAAGTKTSGWDKDTIAVIPSGSNLFSIEHGAVFERQSPESNHPEYIQTPWFSSIVKHEDPPATDLIVQSNPIPLIRDSRAIRILKVQ